MWSLCVRFLPCQREALRPRILAESAPAKTLPSSITGAHVQWPAGQKGSCPHRTHLVVAKTGQFITSEVSQGDGVRGQQRSARVDRPP